MAVEKTQTGFPGNAKSRAIILILMLVDTTALFASLIISLLLRFEGRPFSFIYDLHLEDHFLSLPLALAIYLCAFSALRLYRYAWRFAGLESLWGVIYANSIGLAGMIVIQSLTDGRILPRSVLIIFWLISIVSVGGVRAMLSLASIAYQNREHRPRHEVKRVVILGADTNAARIIRNEQHNDLGELHDRYSQSHTA